MSQCISSVSDLVKLNEEKSAGEIAIASYS